MEIAKLSPKVELIYQAIAALFAKGADLNNLTVAEITAEAGIGKGTAYEYFENKEEMIAGALYYKTQELCVRFYERMKQADNLYDRMQLLFTCMDEQLSEVNCLCRVVHVMVDNSAVSKKMKELAKSHREGSFGVAELIRQMIVDGNGETQIADQEKETYLSLEICSKLICYIMFLSDESGEFCISREKMKQLMCEDICRQAAYFGR